MISQMGEIVLKEGIEKNVSDMSSENPTLLTLQPNVVIAMSCTLSCLHFVLKIMHVCPQQLRYKTPNNFNILRGNR